MTSNGRGGNRYSTYAFTEQGVAMLSSVLRSKIAVETFRLSHDRFLCIDDDVYHIGAKIRLFLVTSKVFEEMLWVSAKRKYAALGRSLIEAPI